MLFICLFVCLGARKEQLAWDRSRSVSLQGYKWRKKHCLINLQDMLFMNILLIYDVWKKADWRKHPAGFLFSWGKLRKYTNCYLLCERAEKGRSVTCILPVVDESNFLEVSQSLCRSLTVCQHCNNVISSDTQSRYSNNYSGNIKLI